MGFNTQKLAGGTVGVSQDSVDFLSHWRFDAVTGRLVADLSIETTLDSLYIGKQQKLSSTGSGVVFTNLSSDVNWQPITRGLKDQSILANRDSTGVIKAGTRVYSDVNYSTIEINGARDLTRTVNSTRQYIPAGSASFFDLKVVCGEALVPTDVLEFKLHHGIGNGSIQVYSQLITGLTKAIDDELIWEFNHQLDVEITVPNIFTEIIKNGVSVFQVRAGATDPTELYCEFGFRSYTREILATVNDIQADRIVSPDGLKDLIITDTDLKYNDGDGTLRFEFDSVNGKIFSPGDTTRYMKVNATSIGFVMEGSNALHITNTQAKLTSKDGQNFIRLKNASVKIDQGNKQKLWMDSASTILSGNLGESGAKLVIGSGSVKLNDGTRDRLDIGATLTKLPSPDGLVTIQIDNTGAFYDGSEILTDVDIGVSVAPLVGGLIPEANLPSFVDDVIEGFLDIGDTKLNGFDSFYVEAGLITIIVGAASKIYIDLNTSAAYRWTGSVFSQIATGLVLGELISNAYRGDRGKIAFDHSQEPHDFSPTIHDHARILSPDALKNLTITDATLKYNDGTRDRIEVDGVTTALLSPDGVQTLTVDNLGLIHNDGTFNRLGILATTTIFVSPDGANALQVDDAGLRVNVGAQDRIDVNATTTSLISPNNLESLTVDDTGAFYNTKQLLTVSSGVQQPTNRISTDRGVAIFDGVTGDRVQSTTVKISTGDVLEYDNYRLITTNIIAAQNQDHLVGPLPADLWIVVPLDVTKLTVRDLNNNIGTFNVRIIFVDGTDELTLTRGHDYVELYSLAGVWYYYNFRTGLGGKVTT